MVKLGYIVQDKVTGIQGIVVAKTEYLYGITRFGIHPFIASTQNGNMKYAIDIYWFEASRLRIVWKLKEFFIDLETQIVGHVVNHKDIKNIVVDKDGSEIDVSTLGNSTFPDLDKLE